MGKESIFEKDENGKPLHIWKPISLEFIMDMPNLSGNAVKAYLFLKSNINIEKNNDEHIWPSLTDIGNAIGIKNRTSITDAIDELVNNGWIAGIKQPKVFNFRNNYIMNNSKKINHVLANKRKKNKAERSKSTKKRIENSKEDSVQMVTTGSHEMVTD